MTFQRVETIKAFLIGLVGYIVTVFLITLQKNSYNILEFCGSYRDFHQQEPVPTVCLSLPEYLSKAIIHPDFALPASIVGLVLGLIYYGKVWAILDIVSVIDRLS